MQPGRYFRAVSGCDRNLWSGINPRLDQEDPLATFEIYKGTDGQFRWRFKAANGSIVAIGGEGFTTKASAQHGIQVVKDDAPTAQIVDLT